MYKFHNQFINLLKILKIKDKNQIKIYATFGYPY